MKIINSYILLLNSFLLISISLNAQINLRPYLNDSIKYDLVLSRVNGDERNNFSELVLKTNLDEKIKNLFFKLPNKELLTLLNDTATSWATNLLLYEKYRTIPILYREDVKNKKDWERLLKEIDIKNWNRLLKQKRKAAANNALPKVRAGHWNNEQQFAYYHLFGVTSFYDNFRQNDDLHLLKYFHWA